jgi:hypothetical protein
MPEMMQASQAMEFASQFFHGQDRLRGTLPPELCAPTYRAEIVGFPAMDAAGHAGFGGAWSACRRASRMASDIATTRWPRRARE